MTTQYTVQDLLRAITQGIAEDHDQIRLTINRDEMIGILLRLRKASDYDDLTKSCKRIDRSDGLHESSYYQELVMKIRVTPDNHHQLKRFINEVISS